MGPLAWFQPQNVKKTNHQISIARGSRLASSDRELPDYTTGKRSGLKRTWKRKADFWKCVISFLHPLASLVGLLQRKDNYLQKWFTACQREDQKNIKDFLLNRGGFDFWKMTKFFSTQVVVSLGKPNIYSCPVATSWIWHTEKMSSYQTGKCAYLFSSRSCGPESNSSYTSHVTLNNSQLLCQSPHL